MFSYMKSMTQAYDLKEKYYECYKCGDISRLPAAFHNLDIIFEEEINKKIFSTMPYQEFLSTDYWQIISKYLYSASNYTCQICGDQDIELNIHHKTYEHRGEEHIFWLTDLIVLCHKCHSKIHNK